MNRSTVIAFALVAAAVIAAIALLVTGGGQGGSDDPTGDVAIGEGGQPPADTSIADVQRATVRREGAEIVFEVRMASDVPTELPKQSMTWRWELYEGGQLTWLVSANVDLGPNVSVLATQTEYQASTVDESLPGRIDVEGSTVTVRIEPDQIDGFPAGFDWLVKTSLDGSRAAAKSAVAEDLAPDGGYQRFDG